MTRSRITCALIPLAFIASACQAWKVEKRPIETVVQTQSGPIAVTMNDLRWVVLKDPVIANDSIVGTRIGGNTFGKGRTALSLRGVRAIEKRRFSFLRTLGLGVAAAFLPSLYKLAVVEE